MTRPQSRRRCRCAVHSVELVMVSGAAAAFATMLIETPPAALAAPATLYWDGNGATPGAGSTPSGTWDSSSPFWTIDSTGASPTAGYTGDAGTTAVFSAGSDATGAFTVTLGGTQIAGGLTFQTGT